MTLNILFWLVVSFSQSQVVYWSITHGQKASLEKKILEPQICENIVFEQNMIYIISWNKDGKTFNYELSEHDVITLIRAVNREGKPQDAVTWLLINRFAWLYPKYYSLANFVKAYAQPINPRWFPDGDLFKASLKNSSINHNTAILKAHSRVLYSKLPLKEIPEYIKNTVYGVLQGKIKNPVFGAQHFIYSKARTVDLEYEAKEKQEEFLSNSEYLNKIIPVESAQKGYNWFFSVNDDSQTFTVKIRKPIDSNLTGFSLIGLGVMIRKLGNLYG